MLGPRAGTLHRPGRECGDRHLRGVATSEHHFTASRHFDKRTKPYPEFPLFSHRQTVHELNLFNTSQILTLGHYSRVHDEFAEAYDRLAGQAGHWGRQS
jgi:hypothetical protein